MVSLEPWLWSELPVLTPGQDTLLKPFYTASIALGEPDHDHY
jgi:hypothetical protein